MGRMGLLNIEDIDVMNFIFILIKFVTIGQRGA